MEFWFDTAAYSGIEKGTSAASSNALTRSVLLLVDLAPPARAEQDLCMCVCVSIVCVSIRAGVFEARCTCCSEAREHSDERFDQACKHVNLSKGRDVPAICSPRCVTVTNRFRTVSSRPVASRLSGQKAHSYKRL